MLKFIGSLLRPYKGKLIIILCAMFVETAMSLAAPWPLKIVLDSVVGHHRLLPVVSYFVGPSLSHGRPMALAAAAALALIFAAIIGSVASYIDTYYTESVGQWVAHDLRVETFHHLERLSLGYFNTHQTGTIVSTLTTDIQTIQNFASSSTLNMLVDLLTIICMLGLMLWLNWDFTLIAVAVTPFLLFFVARFKKAVKSATKEVRKEQSQIVSTVEQGLESMQVVQAFGQEKTEEELLKSVSQATVAAALKARKVKSLLSPVVTITVATCTGIVLWRGAALILTGKMTVGLLTVYLAYLAQFFKPVKDLATTTNAIAQALVGTERIRDILETVSIIPEKEDAVAPESIEGSITFDRVAFGYDGERPILKDMSFTINPGEFIGVVGPTGSGKSTLMSLIPRFYDPQDGKVLIGGRGADEYTLKGLRDKIGFVLQDTVLFRGTILENISFGRPDATREEVIAAAKLANVDEFVDRLPLGYDSPVGERGTGLSGGQRQRIGIARVVLRNSPILLLDEPTAALDSESERLVIEALERFMKGRTVITIAHRLSTIRSADRILVISEGRIAEQGSHEDLLAANGVYAELYHTQFNPDAVAQHFA